MPNYLVTAEFSDGPGECCTGGGAYLRDADSPRDAIEAVVRSVRHPEKLEEVECGGVTWTEPEIRAFLTREKE